MKQITYIYGLVDPITSQLRYVGKSINPNSRFRKHLQDSKKKITYKDKWVFNLLVNNNKPELLIIDIIEDDNWEFWEIFYISYFKSIGCRLTNLTNGGDNPPSNKGKKRSEEVIRRITELNRGQKRSEETRIKISLSKKGNPIPHLNNGKERTLLHKKNLSLSLKGRISNNKGKKFSDEYKNKLSMSHNHQKKEIIQMTLNGDIVKIWESIESAKRELKNNHICECCRGKLKTAAGFIWRYNNN